MTWTKFAGDLKKVGYQVNFGDPGADAVLGFDPQGEGLVLTTEGNWPLDFVAPIHAWITEHKKIGRRINAKCAKCSRAIYANENETAPLCFDCRVGAKSTKRAWWRIREILWGLLLFA